MPRPDASPTPRRRLAAAPPPPWSFDPNTKRAPDAANDDEAGGDHALLRAALRLAGERGSAAAHFAHAQAEKAYFAGGGEPYRWWLAMTRVLDRMLAADFIPVAGSESRPGG